MGNRNAHAKANEEKWNRRAVTYDDGRYDYFRMLQRVFLSTLKIPSPACFLDVGCGTGWAVRRVAEKRNGNSRFVGVDISHLIVRKAVEHSAGGKHVEFGQSDAENLPFPDLSFDTVICTNSFHHYLHPVAVLRDIRRIVKPQGRMHILDVTADDHLIRWMDERTRRKEKEHVRFYGTMDYAGMILQSGLSYIGSYPLFPFYSLKVHVGQGKA